MSWYVEVSPRSGGNFAWNGFTWTLKETLDCRDALTVRVDIPSPERFSRPADTVRYCAHALRNGEVPWLVPSAKGKWKVEVDKMFEPRVVAPAPLFRLFQSPPEPAPPQWARGIRSAKPIIRKHFFFWLSETTGHSRSTVLQPTRDDQRLFHSHSVFLHIDPEAAAEERDKPRGRAAPETPAPQMGADVVYICALHQPELQALLQVGSAPWSEHPHLVGDPQTYHVTAFESAKGTPIRVVAAAVGQMGMSSAGTLAAKMILTFRPRLVVMVGIAAGVSPSRQGFGDILVAEHTFDYGAGKLLMLDGSLQLRPDPKPVNIRTRLHKRLKEWERTERHLASIVTAWSNERPSTKLQMHVGPIASGSAVLDTPQPVADIRAHWRKLLGIEMEAYAVHVACRDSITPEPVFLCMKSICDFAQKKTDHWQEYAAYTSAQLSYRFVTEEWHILFPETEDDS